MSLVDTTTGELVEEFSAAEARVITDRIATGIRIVDDLIVEAYQRRAWAALGYHAWDDYCTREFGSLRLRVPREEREDVVASLRSAGLSIRAIASATGMSTSTVNAQVSRIATPADAEEAEVEALTVTGTDGKTYPAQGAVSRAREAIAARRTAIAEMAESGHTAPQIADAIGLAPNTVYDIAKESGIAVARSATGRTNRDATQIVEQLVHALSGFGIALATLDLAELKDAPDRAAWAREIDDAIKHLRVLRGALKEAA